MDIRQYENLTHQINDARRMYHSGKSKLEKLKFDIADMAIAGHGVTELHKEQIADAELDMRLGKELFESAKQQMVDAVKQITL